MLLVQRAVAWLDWLSVVVDFQIESRTSLGINFARVSLAAHGGFTAQQAVHSCAILLVGIA